MVLLPDIHFERLNLQFQSIAMQKFFYRFIFLSFVSIQLQAQPFTRQDSLRGSSGDGRNWWNVKKYDLSINVAVDKQYISGYNDISLIVTQRPDKNRMQIDLQEPMQIEKIVSISNKQSNIPFKRDGNVYWLDVLYAFNYNIKEQKIRIYFSGNPRKAKLPPWDGGWIWTQDAQGRPWVSVACQGLGASVWYPCKDHQSDEPEQGASLTITVPDSLAAVGNGRLRQKVHHADNTTSWTWVVVNPINNYLLIPYIGKYVNFTEELQGEKGKLDISYWVLDYNLDKAKEHFKVVPTMLQCFEHWMGPYPFYEDSYKLVDAPHLGMEHQSAVAYGNKYLNGYLGMDRSGTGWGSDWDFIIVHESGHEWFANNITSKDIADMWIHEGFTTYTETLFVQCIHGVKAANEYCVGQRRNIRNDKPIIGSYNVNNEGSSDMYDKGANMIHTIRQIINNDTAFRNILRGLNRDFYHQAVTTKQIENYIIQASGKKLQKVFDQYLRTTQIPNLQYKLQDGYLYYRWTNCVKGFDMPVKLTNGAWIFPTETFTKMKAPDNFGADANFYITVSKTPV